MERWHSSLMKPTTVEHFAMLYHATKFNPQNHYAANVSGSSAQVLAQLQEVSSTGHCQQELR